MLKLHFQTMKDLLKARSSSASLFCAIAIVNHQLENDIGYIDI